MKKKYAILFLIFLLTNCHTDNLSISLDTAQPLEAIPLFIKGSSNYIYELKVTDTHLVVFRYKSRHSHPKRKILILISCGKSCLNRLFFTSWFYNYIFINQ